MPRCRGLLDHLLVTSLQGAVAVAQVDGVALAVGEHLDFDVTRTLQEFLHVHDVEPNTRPRLRLRVISTELSQRRLVVHNAHPAAAAAGSRLDNDRVAHLAAGAKDRVGIRQAGGLPSPVPWARRPRCMASLADTLSPIRRMVSAWADKRNAAAPPARQSPRFPRESRTRVNSRARVTSAALMMAGTLR